MWRNQELCLDQWSIIEMWRNQELCLDQWSIIEMWRNQELCLDQWSIIEMWRNQELCLDQWSIIEMWRRIFFTGTINLIKVISWFNLNIATDNEKFETTFLERFRSGLVINYCQNYPWSRLFLNLNINTILIQIYIRIYV